MFDLSRRRSETVSWRVALVAIATAAVLLYVIAGRGGETESPDAYLTIRNKAVADKTPLLVAILRHDCEPCRRLEKDVLPNLNTKGYALARLYHDVDRQRAMRVMWGSQAKSLNAMQKTKIPQLILYLPCRDGRWLKYRLVPAPT